MAFIRYAQNRKIGSQIVKSFGAIKSKSLNRIAKIG
jgi:hypothetical protein